MTRMKKLLFILLLITSYGHCQIPEYDKYHNNVKPTFESNEFIIWSGDTLNRRNQNNLKTGKWIEYKVNYTIETSSFQNLMFDDEPQPELYTEIDTISVRYEIQGIGSYRDNLRTGKWATFYRNKTIKAEVSFKDGRVSGNAKIYYNKWPAILKYEGTITQNNKETEFKYFSEEGKFINTEVHSLYQLLKKLEKQSTTSGTYLISNKGIDF